MTNDKIKHLRELHANSTTVVQWYPHREDGTVRGPFCRWFTCSKVEPEYEKNVGAIEADVEYCAAAMNAVPELITRIEYLEERRTHHSAVTLTVHELTKNQLAEAKAENVCDACAGEAKSDCMCNGTGLMSRAAIYLREELVKAHGTIEGQEIKLAEAVEVLKFISGLNSFNKELPYNGAYQSVNGPGKASDLLDKWGVK